MALKTLESLVATLQVHKKSKIVISPECFLVVVLEQKMEGTMAG